MEERGERDRRDKSVGAFRGRTYASYAHATLVTYHVKTVLIFEQWVQEIFLVFTGIIVSRLRDSNVRSHVSLIREEWRLTRRGAHVRGWRRRWEGFSSLMYPLLARGPRTNDFPGRWKILKDFRARRPTSLIVGDTSKNRGYNKSLTYLIWPLFEWEGSTVEKILANSGAYCSSMNFVNNPWWKIASMIWNSLTRQISFYGNCWFRREYCNVLSRFFFSIPFRNLIQCGDTWTMMGQNLIRIN